MSLFILVMATGLLVWQVVSAYLYWRRAKASALAIARILGASQYQAGSSNVATAKMRAGIGPSRRPDGQ